MHVLDDSIKVYVFSDGVYPYTEDFSSVLKKVELIAMPSAIFQALKNVLPSPKDKELTRVSLSAEEALSEMKAAIEAESGELFNE